MKHDDETLQAAIDAACNETFQHHETLTGSDIIIDPSIKPHWANEAAARLTLAKAFLAKLPEPILADDGRSLEQTAKEAFIGAPGLTDDWMNAAAQTVANVVLAQAIRRMESVPVEEVAEIIRRQWLDRGGWIEPAADALRARLIQAAKGQGEQPDTTDWKARAEKAEAELAALKSSQIGILRPLAEAGPVPEGCVRLYGACDHHEDRWSLTALKWDIDTHFTDIRLPVTETPAIETADPAAEIEAMREAIKESHAIIERYSESAISHANQLMCPECLRIEAFDEEHKDSCAIGKALTKLQPFIKP